MKRNLRKQVDTLTKMVIFIKFAVLEIKRGEKRKGRISVAKSCRYYLSPHISNLYKKRDQKSLSKKDAIQVSYFGHRPMVPNTYFLKHMSLSDTLNSSPTYYKKSNITIPKKKRNVYGLCKAR